MCTILSGEDGFLEAVTSVTTLEYTQHTMYLELSYFQLYFQYKDTYAC